MAAIEGSVTIGGFIAPSDTTDTYPSHVDIYGRGGMRSVANNTERDAITSDRRSEGMFVYVLDSDGSGNAELYTLSGGITNNDWIEAELGGGGGYWQQVNASTSIYFVPGSGDGRVGIGTNSPSYDLHVSKDSPGGIVYTGVENTSPFSISGAGTYYIAANQKWSNLAKTTSYQIVNDTGNRTPFEIETSAPHASIIVGQYGVGIGKTAASGIKLDVDGNIRFASDGAGANYLEFVRSSSNNWKLGSSGVGEIFSQVGNASNWKQDFTATRRYIKSAPTVEQASNGVGYPAIWGQQTWTNAAYRHRHLFLDVTDNTGGTTGSTIIEVQKNGTVGFVVDKDFNVGIGTSSPNGPLHVVGNTYLQGDLAVGPQGNAGPISGYTLSVRDTTPSIYLKDQSGLLGDGRLHVSSNLFKIGADPGNVTANAALVFETRGSERMRIDHDGNVGIGTATPEEKLHVAGNIKLDGTINSANLTPTDRYDVRNWTYTGKRTLDNSTFNPIQLLANARGLFFKDDGTKMYISDDGNDAIYEYNLSIAWDIETAVQSYKLSTVTNPPSANVPYSIFFSSDGTVLFLADNDEKTVQVWDLSIAWDLSTASSNDSKKLVVTSLVTEVTNMSSLFFNPDGNIMLVYDFNTEKIYRFDLSTAWDPSTATHTSSTLNMASAADYPGLPTLNGSSPQNYFGIWVLDDGLTMYTSEYQTDTFIQWSMSTAWDITTLSIVRYTSTPRGNDILIPAQFYFADSVKKLFVLDDNTDNVFEFDTSAGVNIRSLSSGGKVFSEKGEFNGLIVNGVLDVRGGTDTQGLTAQSSGINTTGSLTVTGGLQTGRSTGNKSAYINYYQSKADPNDTQTYRTHSYAGINIRHHNESYDQVDIGSHSNSYINIVGEVDNIGSTDITGQIRVQNKKTLRESITPSGTIVHRDTFTESFDTDITVHTPDVGSAYTIQNTDGVDATAFVSGGNGYATTSPSPNDNEGITVLCNTTLPTDYVAKWEFSSSSSLPIGDSYVFTILLNYKDNDNFDILRLSRDADDTILYVRRAGVLTYGHIQTEIKNIGGERGDYTTTYNTDTLNSDLWSWAGNKNPASLTLEARKVGDYLVLIYDGIIGYVAEVDWFASHKIGFGWGANSLTNSNDEAHDSWKLDSFTVQEITDRDLDSVSYIENGNVGIGTTSPVHTLDLKTNPAIGFYHSDGTYQGLIGDGSATVAGGGTYDIGFRANSGYNLLFAAGGSTERMRIDSSGNVGIGTTTPQSKLQVDGETVIGGGVTTGPVKLKILGTGDRGGSIRAYADSFGSTGLIFGLEGSTGGNFQFASNVTPTSNLTYSLGSSGLVWSQVWAKKVTGRTNSAEGELILNAGTTSNPIRFTIADTEYMRLNNDGNFGIGTTSPSEKLHVSGKIKVIYGTENVLIGDAGNNITGYSNTALGSFTLRDATAANQNVAIGQQAQRYTTGNYNVTVGTQANMYTTGGNNVALGGLAAKGDASSTFTNTVAVGYQALTALSTGTGNTAVGYEASKVLTTSIETTNIGYQAGRSGSSGASYNTYIGYQSGMSGSSAQSNTMVGHKAGTTNSTGDNNTSLGTGSSLYLLSGGGNVAIGAAAMLINSTGSDNVMIGHQSGRNATGSSNVFIGHDSGYNETGSNKLYIANSDTATPLIYGEFDNNILRVNGALQVGDPANTGFALPSTDGTSGQVLSTNGSGTVTWATVSSGGTDTNLGSNDLTSTATTRKFTLYSDNSTLGIFRSGGTNPIAYFTQGGASGANAVSVYGELNVYEDTSGNAELRLRDSSNNYAAIQASASTTSYTITLPSSGPGAGSKILESDASGNLSWINTPTGGGVNVSGTPINNQLAVWTNSTDIEGDGNLTWSGTELLVQGELRADVIEINGRANASSQPAGTIGAGSKVMTQGHTAGTVTAGRVYVLGSSAWTASDADAGSTSIGLLAVATDAASPSEMLLEGSVTMSSNTGFSTAAKGDVLYLSATTGELTDTAPSTAGQFVRICGYVIDASKSEVFFSPDKTWLEI